MDGISYNTAARFLKTAQGGFLPSADAAMPSAAPGAGIKPAIKSRFDPNRLSAAARNPVAPVDPGKAFNSQQGSYLQYDLQGDNPASQQQGYRYYQNNPHELTRTIQQNTKGYTPAQNAADLWGRDRSPWDTQVMADDYARLGYLGYQIASNPTGRPLWQNAIGGVQPGVMGKLSRGLGGALAYDWDPTQEGHTWNAGMVTAKNALPLLKNVATGTQGLRGGLATSAKASPYAAPIYLGVDALSEGYHSYNRGRELAPDSWAGKQLAIGFHDRSKDIAEANQKWQGAGGYATQALDNIGHPIQMLYTGPREAAGVLSDYAPFVGRVAQTRRENARIGEDYSKALQAANMQDADTPFGKAYERRYHGDRGMFYDREAAKQPAKTYATHFGAIPDFNHGYKKLHELPDWAQYANYNSAARPFVDAGTTAQELATLRTVDDAAIRRITSSGPKTPQEQQVMQALLGSRNRRAAAEQRMAERQKWWDALTPEQQREVVSRQVGVAASAAGRYAKKTLGSIMGRSEE